MADNQASPSDKSHAAATTQASSSAELRLEEWPRFFALPTHLSVEEVHEIEEELELSGAPVTYEITEAQVILTAIQSLRRAKFELQTRGLSIDIFEQSDNAALGKRKRSAIAAADKSQEQNADQSLPLAGSGTTAVSEALEVPKGQLVVVKREWLSDSLDNGHVQNLGPYIILRGKSIGSSCSAPEASSGQPSSNASRNVAPAAATSARRQQQPAVGTETAISQQKPLELRRSAGSNVQRHLLHETTSEHDEAQSRQLPEPPRWVKERKIYSCERSTPLNCPNDEFIALLKKIKLVRTLNMDEIGVRAYSTSIASIAAYPYPLTDARELLDLPGCEQKIALLFREFQTSGQIAESKVIDEDESLKTINSFYNIWGVGAKTARDFYHERGWRHTDDIIQHGWNSLPRVQQIGLKYFDEFEKKIPRSEVEFIASVVTYHTKQIVDDDITCTIVGGYRRGKPESGDADIVISHPRESSTLFLIKRLVGALESAKWITHTLTLTETNSARDQQPLGLRSDGSRGSGFDTLDKALVVWQDPSWPKKEAALAKNPKAKNPNVHRRVDIIISPWRTVGCAITGWTSGTTFQRDLRRYIKHTKGWKFDSSGVRDRGTGRWVDLERYSDEANRAKTPLEAEKRVFEGLGLQWRRPEERCTG
ncbi:MAG: hypothetical protein MMC23_008377 [Stictis urceolatum]|nr:hypothetical protein [Stictis urceolata]